MALSKELLGAVESVVQTDAELKSFEQGYLLGLDGTREVRFEGQVLPQFFGGLRLRYRLEENEVEAQQTDGEEFISGKPTGYSEDPAFILGAALAGCKLKQEGHVEESWADKLPAHEA